MDLKIIVERYSDAKYKYDSYEIDYGHYEKIADINAKQIFNYLISSDYLPDYVEYNEIIYDNNDDVAYYDGERDYDIYISFIININKEEIKLKNFKELINFIQMHSQTKKAGNIA